MATWAPLHDGPDSGAGSPFPLNEPDVRTYANGITATAELIDEQVTVLRNLTQSEYWETDAADAFRETGEKLAEWIERLSGRYQETGKALTNLLDGGCAGRAYDDVKQEAADKAALARDAQQTIANNPEVEPGTGDDGLPEDLTPEQTAQNSARSDALEELQRLQNEFDRLVDDAREAATNAANAISAASDDGVKDDFWDKWGDLIKIFLTIAGIVVAILAIVIGGTLLAIIGAVIAVAGLIVAIMMHIYADGSWSDVIWAAVGVITLGLGTVLSRLAKPLTGMLDDAMTLAARQVRNRAFLGSLNRLRGVPRGAFSWASNARIPVKLPFLKPQSLKVPGVNRLGDAGMNFLRHRGLNAANLADDAFRNINPGRLRTLITGSRENALAFEQVRRALPELSGEMLHNMERLRTIQNVQVALNSWSLGKGGYDWVNSMNSFIRDPSGETGFSATTNTINRIISLIKPFAK